MKATPDSSDLPCPAAALRQPHTTAPGEFIHYYMNLLTLFRARRSVAQIEDLAHAAVANRDTCMAEFSSNLQQLGNAFLSETRKTAQRATQLPAPVLDGIDTHYLESVRAQHGGLLVALFHYGRHRQVLADLSCLGLPFVAPVAKRAYFECNDLAKIAPPPFEHAMQLVEVEDPRVGRVLLQSLRAGRVGLIYVDGNMGPDGHLVAEGAIEIDFLGCRIRVKAGIARLAQSLRLPILPLLVHEQSGDRSRVRFGQLLQPVDRSEAATPELREADQQRLMQSLYDALGTAVQDAPQYWEFAYCLHRWLAQAPDATGTASTTHAAIPDEPGYDSVAADASLSIPRSDVALFERDGEEFWVHVGRQKAYRLPLWACGLYSQMQTQVVRNGDAMQWLCARGAVGDEAQVLLQGLLARNLLQASSEAAATH